MSAFPETSVGLEKARLTAARLGWLSRQPRAFAETILDQTELHRFGAGKTVTSLDEKPGGISCVVAGLVGVLVAPGPFPTKLVYIARPGWWFGDIPMISRSERRAGLVARKECWILHIPERKVAKLVAEDPEAWRRFAELTVAHFDNALYLAASLSTQDLRQRLAALICWLTGTNAFSEEANEIPLTRAEIGEIAGLSRNASGRILSELAQEGLIDARYGRLVVKDRAGLEGLLRS